MGLRSSGCFTCRRRKKGCDKTRPVCQRCVKAGLHCAGYGETLVWVNSTTADGQTLSGVSASALQPWTAKYASLLATGPDTRIALPTNLATTAREQLYFGVFTAAILPGGRKYSERAANLASVGWANCIPQLTVSETALRYASIGVAMAVLSLDNKDSQLRVKSLQTYNNAVCEVARALRRPDWYQRDGLLAAVRLMSFYEVLIPPADKSQMLAWREHNEGQQAMFLARGPQAFISGAAHRLYVDARINMAIIAIGRRRRSPFNTNAWKTVPWSSHTKSVKDEMLDIVEELPTVLEQLSAFQALQSRGNTTQLEKMIISQCKDLEQKFAAWEQKVRPDILRFDYTATNGPLPAPTDDADFALLHLSVTYWIALMILNSVMNFFSQRRSAAENEHPTCTSANPTAAHEALGLPYDYGCPHKSPDLYVSKCAHALHLYFGRDGGLVEGISGLLTLSFALRYSLVAESEAKRDVDMRLLRETMAVETFGSTVGALMAHISGGKLGMDTTAVPSPAAGNQLSWF